MSSVSSETQACCFTASKAAVYIDASTIVLRAPSRVSPDLGCRRISRSSWRSALSDGGVRRLPYSCDPDTPELPKL
jgi:hypothetical protein